MIGVAGASEKGNEMRKVFLVLVCFLMTLAVGAEETSKQNQIMAALLAAQADASNAQTGALKLAVNLTSAPINKVDKTIIQSLLNTVQYYVTPGDIYQFVLIMGPMSYPYTLSVQADHIIQIPVLGPIDTEDMTYLDLKNNLLNSLRKRMPVDFLDFYMLSPATFEVFVGGEVRNPGAFVCTSLMRVSDALVLADGNTSLASYRTIEIKNPKHLTKRIDLFRYFETGEDVSNCFLRQGDVIYVPRAEKLVRLSGEVVKSAIYELMPGETVQDLLRFAGGLSKEADRDVLEVRRINPDGTYSIFTIGLLKENDFQPADGDKINARPATQNTRFVTVEGALFGKPIDGRTPIQMPQINLDTVNASSASVAVSEAPSSFLNSIAVPIKVYLSYFQGMTLANILDILGGPTPFAIGDQSVIYRKNPTQTIPFNVEDVWRNPEKAKAIQIFPDDYVLIPMDNQIIMVMGEVNVSRIIPLMYKRKLRDYLMACGGITSTGDARSIWLYDKLGKKVKHVDMEYDPKAGDIFYVDKTIGAAILDFVTVTLPFFTAVGGAILIVNQIIQLFISSAP
jgi:protein involved in polysaccharide export with SLBB domain